MGTVGNRVPAGTPTWVELRVADVAAAREFYGALFFWDFGPEQGSNRVTCLQDGNRVAGLVPVAEPVPFWDVYLAVDDCGQAVERALRAGAGRLAGPTDLPGRRVALLTDPTGARVGLWEATGRVGCELVNEPGSLVRNDLLTPEPEAAWAFYAGLFDFTVEAGPGADFTFLRRPDGHEVGGIAGADGPPHWATVFEVADTDAVCARAEAAGGAVGDVVDLPYGRLATLLDPGGVEFLVITRS